MKQLNIQPIIEGIRKSVKLHETEGRHGEYRRWHWQNEKGTREMCKSEYGCADAMNLLYTINDFYCDEKTHHTYHTTAYCPAVSQSFSRSSAVR